LIVKDSVVVVTGAGSGIGRALCEVFAEAGARTVVAADLDLGRAQETASALRGAAFRCDVGKEEDVRGLIETVEAQHGPIDLFCSNAGIGTAFDMSFDNAAVAPNADWERAWSVNVMAHVYAARHLVPSMKRRGRGHFLQTISAAGLLSQIGSAVYSTTKHAAVGFAENLAITHRDDGIRVSILCPQAVDTPMLAGLPDGPQSIDGVMSAPDVPRIALEGVEKDAFLILPHAQVVDYMRRKTADYDRWIGGMAKLNRQFAPSRS
jgi:NAD(P)-dependent dehydrogenase (short-subunit alcohol dehydrogenase family)